MIILRQKLYAFGGFDWWFDENGKEKPDLTEEDKRKLDAFKKKYPREWEDFQNRKKYSSGSGSSYSRPSSSSSSGSSSSKSRSSSSSSRSSSSSSSSTSDWYEKYKKQKEQWDEEDRRWQEEFEKRQEKARTDLKNMDKDIKQSDKAWKLLIGTNIINGGKEITKAAVKGARRKAVNSKIGHDYNMKDYDRGIIENYKSLSNKEKELLKKVASSDKEESKKAERKYKTRRAVKGAVDAALTGASLGGGIGFLSDDIKVTKNWAKGVYGQSKSVKRMAKGAGLGALGGAFVGAGLDSIQSKKQLNKIKNSKDKQRAEDRVKVAQGKMTEHEFVKKHGGGV